MYLMKLIFPSLNFYYEMKSMPSITYFWKTSDCEMNKRCKVDL